MLLNVAGKRPLPESPEQLVNSAPELEAQPVVAQRVLASLRDERTTLEVSQLQQNGLDLSNTKARSTVAARLPQVMQPQRNPTATSTIGYR